MCFGKPDVERDNAGFHPETNGGAEEDQRSLECRYSGACDLEILDGAAGCASGSQMWNGIMPAFTPKPMAAQRKINDRSNAGIRGPALLSDSNPNAPVKE